MCAINPVHKKRLIMDFYTAQTDITKEQFDEAVYKWALENEQRINTFSKIRVHVRDTDQQAD